MASTDTSDARLLQLEGEIRRQREMIAEMSSRLGRQNDSLDSLKASVMLMIASWHSDVGVALSRLSDTIGEATGDQSGRGGARRQIEGIEKEPVPTIDAPGGPLTELESRVFYLGGQDLTAAEISKTLNISENSLQKICEQLREKTGSSLVLRTGRSRDAESRARR
jgi:uncharacterized coiled-coil protein SlyX